MVTSGKLPSRLARSPPGSPTRTHIRTSSLAAKMTNKPSFKSKLLATLDAEIPKWLAGPPIPNVAKLVSVANTTERPVNRRPYDGKLQTTISAMAIQRTTSDIENYPEVTVVDDLQVNVVDAVIPIPLEKVALPLYSYKAYRPDPAVVYTRHEDEANEMIQALKGPLGFDLEWVVFFRRGQTPREKRTALVQLCDARLILLIQVSAMNKFPQKLKEVLENKDIVKMGANIRNDGQKLFRDYGILASNLVELGALARQADPNFSLSFKRSIVALAKVVERYTGRTLDKGKVRTSDWEAKLSPTQIMYAANDAHCALMVYNNLMSLAAASEREINLEQCAADLAKEYREKSATVAVGTVPRDGEEERYVAAAVERTPTTSSTDTLPAPTAVSSMFTNTSRPTERSSARPLSYAGEYQRQPSTGQRSASSFQATGPYQPGSRQHQRAYNLWHQRDMPLHEICAALRSKENPLAESTVISYVVRALQANPSLPFSMDRLKTFVQLEAGSWVRHRDWILQRDGYKKP